MNDDELGEDNIGEIIPPKSKRNEKQFDKIPVDISLDELKTEGAIKMLLSDRDRLFNENIELRSIQKKYYTEQKIMGAAEVKFDRIISFEFLRDFSVVWGGVFLGLASCNISDGSYNTLFLILGIVITALSLLTKWLGSIVRYFKEKK